MRAKEFLFTEASVFKTTNNQYVPGYRMAISTKGGGSSVKAVQSVVPGFDPAEELVIVDPSTPSTYKVQLSKATDASFKLKRPGSDEVIELIGTKSAIQSSLNGIGPAIDPSAPQKQKMPNKGDTAEGLLGAAMFAKLVKREGSHVGNITTDDLWHVFDKLKPVNDNDYMVTSKDVGGATDKIWFRLKVKGFVKTALMNPAMRKKLTDWALSPVNYVNSKEGQEYADQFYKNGQPDEVGVISDGLSAQSEKKTDVFTVVREPGTNKVKKELLPISLKAGADQFAQHSGSSWKAMDDMFSAMGIDIDAAIQKISGDGKSRYNLFQSQNKQLEAASYIYSQAAKIFNSSINDDKEEAKFISDLSKALKFWATNNDDNVRVVSFGSRGSFEVLRFDQLEPKMASVKLFAEFVPGENPRLLIKDQQQGLLLQIRTYLQAKNDGTMYQRNVIEKGPLLGKLANAIEQPAQAPAQPAATKPAQPVKKVAPRPSAPKPRPAQPQQQMPAQPVKPTQPIGASSTSV